MKEGDVDTHYAFYAFHKLKMLPSDYLKLDIFDKAALVAFIDIKRKDDEKEMAKVKKK